MLDVAVTQDVGASLGSVRPGKLSKGALGWALHQGARDPYVVLITIYIFAPYFSRMLVGDPVRGQALVADIGVTYGLITAFTAPLLGASIEQFGRRKPILFVLMSLMAPLLAALWFAAPGGAELSVFQTSAILVALGVLFNWGDVLNNSLISRAAGPGQLPLLSGLGFSFSNIISVTLLVLMLWGFVLPGTVHWVGVPAKALFGLNPSRGEPSRLSGPLCAAVLLLGSIPFYLYTPDAKTKEVGLVVAFRCGLATLGATLGNLRGDRDVVTFLGARMLYCDGMTALLMFGGLFAAGLMHWGALELLGYAISLSIFAVLGGLTAPRLEHAVGPRRAVQIEIAVTMAALIGMLGMNREKIFYVWRFVPAAHAPIWNGPMFRTLPELIYVGLGLVIAVTVTASYASSRSLLAQLAPPERSAAFFGLYALSGTATVWFGSMLVAIATTVFHSQIAGFVPIIGLLLVGGSALFLVRGGDRATATV